MVKSSNPWLRSLLRAGKQQQRTVARAVKSMLAAPKAKAKAGIKAKAGTAARPKAAPKPSARKPVAPAPPAGQWLTLHYAGFSSLAGLPPKHMSYRLYLPDRLQARSASAGVPLIVMLHGCDQNATLFAQGTRMNELAELKGYAVLYPQQSLAAHAQRCWKWYDRATQQGGGDVALIVGIVARVAQSYPIDRSRIYICGISAGAAMANIVALNHPELFAGQGLHSAPVFGAAHNAAGALAVMRHGAGAHAEKALAEVLARRPAFPSMPTILIQGEADRVVYSCNQEQLARQSMLLNGLAPTGPARLSHKAGTSRSHPYDLRDVYRGRKLMLRVARVAGLGHAWSGGDERHAYHCDSGPDASRMMLSFFERHRRLAGPPH